jgi:hypothetical protein
MRRAISVVVVSVFALVFMHGAWAIRLVNPVFSRYLGVGLPGGPGLDRRSQDEATMTEMCRYISEAVHPSPRR